MKKKHYATFVLCLLCLHLPSQEWCFHYTGEFPNGHIHLTDGFIDREGVTFFAGHEGPDSDSPNALFMRIEANGQHQEFNYRKNGYHSKATCLLELPNGNLFAAGNLYAEGADSIMTLILDKQLNLLEERHYGKEVEALSFGPCKALLDSHGKVILSTYVRQDNGLKGSWFKGVFFKFDEHGDTLSHRYLIADEPDPIYYFMSFKLRQMWYDGDTETLLCLAPGYGNAPSFITFDAAFNYLEEHPIWRDNQAKPDHTLHLVDCYTDHWYSKEEALFFSSRGDYEHNDLRISRINTHGDFLDYIHLTQTPDTIFDPATDRCMATANDSTIYYSYGYHFLPLYPGVVGVLLFNERLELLGRYLRDDCENYRPGFILPTSEGGCIVVSHHSPFQPFETSGYPVIEKLSQKDFETVPFSLVERDSAVPPSTPYPNPADGLLFLPLAGLEGDKGYCQVFDSQGRILLHREVTLDGQLIRLDITHLNAGTYLCRILSSDQILHTVRFIKN